MNFTINQTNGIRETVNSEFINKLYNLFITNRSSHTISLSGYLYSPTGYKAQMDALNSLYGPDLVIEVPEAGLYILIEDPAVLLILINNNISSDGIGISALDASTANLTTSMFKNNTNITSFNLFKYFTRSNNNPVNELFRGCTNLESVDLSGVIRISTLEFQSSGIKNINAPSLQSLGENAFSYSKVENILDLGLVIEIPYMCFSECPNLVSVDIPETVTSLGNSAFNAYNTSYNRVFTTITGLNNVQNFGVRCFCSLTSLNLNGSDINSAVSIKSEAFSNVRLFSGDLNLKNLLVLEQDAFRNTKISKILCLGKIARIPAYAFVSDTSYDFKSSLTEVYLPYECSSIGSLAFYYRTGLKTLKQYTLSVDNWIEGETPAYGDITRVTSFGSSCFNNCSLLVLSASNFSKAVTTIGQSAFYNCTNLTGEIDLPSLSSLGANAFYKSGITKVKNLGSITELAGGIFGNCSSLTEVNIPLTVTSIANGIFENCPNLRKITGWDNITTVTVKTGYLILNTTITNPIGLKSFTTFTNSAASIFFVLGQNQDMNVHSLYYTKLPSTASASETWYGTPKHTFFLSNSIGNKKLVTGLLYFRDITSFGTGTFFSTNITNLVINNTTPPTFNNSDTTYNTESWWSDWGEYLFGNGNNKCIIGTLWVPDSAIATYQANPLYSMLTIKGINTKTNGVDYDLPRYANFAAWEAAEEAAVAQGGHAPLGLIEAWM